MRQQEITARKGSVDSVGLRLVHVTNAVRSFAFGFFSGQIGFMRQQGFDVYGVCSPGRMVPEIALREGIQMHTVSMPRYITPMKDLQALWRLVILFRRLKPTIVHSHTPKGGLLGALGAWVSRVPIRIYTLRGLRMMTTTGLKRHILKYCEKLTCLLVHRVFCISRSLRSVAIAQDICPSAKIKVLCNGSSNGVDANMFSRVRNTLNAGNAIRAAFGVPQGARVLGFVGRVVRDKGIAELVAAWKILRDEFPDLHLVAVGPLEPQDPVSPNEIAFLKADARVHLASLVAKQDMPGYYATMDVLAFPTYREGFGNVCIEAAAMELPVVGTRIPGCVDAVEDGVTGILVPLRDSQALTGAIRTLLKDPDLRRSMGQAGRKRVLRDFRPEPIWEALYLQYMRLLSNKGLPIDCQRDRQPMLTEPNQTDHS